MTTVHHSAICVRDVDASLRFYRDGLGLETLMDHAFDGDWPSLFDAPSTRLRSVFLGDPGRPDVGIVELVAFDGAPPVGPATAGPLAAGFFLLSFFVEVDETLARFEDLGLGRDVRRIEVPGPDGPVAMATLRDPDGVLVELVGAPR
ncbi:MAG TPA: VOC family protein [Acidimicrobiia bacterium]|nr:VOC family protein [Acidimicrobiia bacterium]